MIIKILFATQSLALLFPNATSGAFIYQISCLGIIFIVLEQTISGALHGLGKMLTPAIALGIGVIIKFILNMYLIPINPSDFFLGGTAGAAISTVVCHAVALTIEFKILSKNINLKLDKNKFIVKPVIACLIMGTIAYIFNITLFQCLNEKISTMLLILMCVIIYILLLIILRVFSEEEIYMIPYGSKIYNFLKKLRLYDNG